MTTTTIDHNGDTLEITGKNDPNEVAAACSGLFFHTTLAARYWMRNHSNGQLTTLDESGNWTTSRYTTKPAKLGTGFYVWTI